MIFLNLQVNPLTDLAVDLRARLDKAMQEAARDLSAQAHAHLVELVQKELHSSRSKYLKALSFDQVNESTWVINLDKSALFIEDGLPPGFDLLKGLLSSAKAKTSKTGSRYLSVPFEHSRGPTTQTPAQLDLTNTVREEMKKLKIPYGKVETDESGRPKLGLLHKFDIRGAPLKSHNGPGMGSGPVGAVRQGREGTPFLAGVRVYQKAVKGADGRESVKRAIMTFRTASSAKPDKWKHPGLAPRGFLDKTAEWALDLWERQISKKVFASLSSE